MSVGIVVRNERHENLSSFVEFVPIVAWEHRAQFPMLTHQDPYGRLILNQRQVETLLKEVTTIELRISELGLVEALKALGSPLVSLGPEHETELAAQVRDFIERLRELSAETLTGVHRYLWFIGD